MDTFPVGMLEEYEKFFASESTRESGRLVYDEVFDSGTFFPLQRKREMERMLTAARAVFPKVVYEIGADKGGGLYHWCKSITTAQRIIACEIRGVPYAPLFEKAFPHLDFLWLAQSSYAEETVQRVKSWLNGDLIDVLFIDGDKNGFIEDFVAYLPMVRIGGTVFMHDVRDDGPNRAWRYVCENTPYEKEHILDISESLAAKMREDAGVPSGSAYESWLRYWKGASASVRVIKL